MQRLADKLMGDYRPHSEVVFDFSPMDNAEAYIELHLWPGAPTEVALAAHRALCKIYRRDRLNTKPLDDALRRIQGLDPNFKARPQRA